MPATKMDTLFDDDRDAPPASQGFRASISGLNLFEFVQIECLTGARRAVRVTSGNRIGYLFFEDGAVTHALTPDAHGEVAARQILSWVEGALDECSIEAPEHARVHAPWQQILLRAAQAKDEQSRGNLVEFPRSKSPPDAVQVVPNLVAAAPKPEREPQSTSRPRTHDGVLGAVRLDAFGQVTSKRGDTTELAGLAEYALRLAELLGAALGAGELSSVDARFGRTRCAIKKESTKGVVIVRALTQPIAQPSDAGSAPQPTGVPREAFTLALAGLRDIEGVFGSFLVGVDGQLLASDLPKVFESDMVQEVCGRLERLRAAFETLSDDLRSLEIRYREQRLYMRVSYDSLIGILNSGSNPTLLSMAATVVARKLHGLGKAPVELASAAGTHGSSLAAARASAPNLEARSSAPAAITRSMAAPGAPSAPSARTKSSRPVFFRGRPVQ
jgi:predicted regulator of Ras-like GTPase activity (Roadblock/LC7/MglB family)